MTGPVKNAGPFCLRGSRQGAADLSARIDSSGDAAFLYAMERSEKAGLQFANIAI